MRSIGQIHFSCDFMMIQQHFSCALSNTNIHFSFLMSPKVMPYFLTRVRTSSATVTQKVFTQKPQVQSCGSFFVPNNPQIFDMESLPPFQSSESDRERSI